MDTYIKINNKTYDIKKITFEEYKRLTNKSFDDYIESGGEVPEQKVETYVSGQEDIQIIEQEIIQGPIKPKKNKKQKGYAL